MPRSPILAIAPLTAALLLGGGTTAGAQECEAGTISYVFVDNHSVFDTEEIREETSFRWAYELANRLHMTTREEFIRKELLFAAGECYEPLLLEESERLLRNYPFVARADVFGLEQSDGSWHVVVDTKDEWTTKVNLRIALEEGVEFRGVSATEENLLGRGYLAGVFFRKRQEEQDLGARFFTPRIFGTRLDAGLEIGTTRSGTFFTQELFYPFVGEIGRFAFREIYIHRDELFRYIPPPAADFDYVLVPLDERRLEVTVAGRLGRPGNLTVFGLGFSNETLEFPRFPVDVEVTPEGDFEETEPAPAGITDEIHPQTIHSGATRLNLLFGQRNVRFVRREGLDALQGVQDVQVGMDVSLTVGRSVSALSAGHGQPDDLYTRLRYFGGFARGPLTANLALALEGRQIFAGGEQGDGWRDVLGELDALAYWQPPGLSNHTLLLRVAGGGGWNMTLPYQLTLGGPAGVRGFGREAFPGAHKLLLTVEDRIFVPWPFPDLADFGFTLFADAGRMWAGDVPFGDDSDWRGTVGGGLRVGFPAGSRGVVRIDLALPLVSGAGFDDLMVRVSLRDLIGLAGGVEDEQLRRSRRVTVGPDLFTRQR